MIDDFYIFNDFQRRIWCITLDVDKLHYFNDFDFNYSDRVRGNDSLTIKIFDDFDCIFDDLMKIPIIIISDDFIL